MTRFRLAPFIFFSIPLLVSVPAFSREGTPARVQEIANLAELDRALGQLAIYQYGESIEPRNRVSSLLRRLQTSGEIPKAVEDRFLNFLQSGASLPGKQFICRQLGFFGTERSGPVLASMLVAPETAEMARHALEQIPGPSVDKILSESLPNVTDRQKVGIIVTLGVRRAQSCAESLATFLHSDNAHFASAAAYSLGQIGGRHSLRALSEALGTVQGRVGARVIDALLDCADREAEDGDRQAALRVYGQLSSPKWDQPVRLAALEGIIRTSGEAAGAEMASAIADPDPEFQAAVIRLLHDLPGARVRDLLASKYDHVDSPVRIVLLTALADRGDTRVAPLHKTACADNDPDVRIAALTGLGKLGDASAVHFLAATAARVKGPEQQAARASLTLLKGTAIDRVIADGILAAAPEIKVELIRAAGNRGTAKAVGSLFAAARDHTRPVRRASLAALRSLVAPSDVPSLLQLLDESPTHEESQEIAACLSSALKRGEPADPQPVISAYARATDTATRAALLDVLAAVPHSQGLPVLRAALHDEDPDIRRAGIVALSGWPDPAPLPDLLRVLKETADESHRILALRSFLSLLSLPSDRFPPESVALLVRALQFAHRIEERKAALGMLPNWPCLEALDLAESWRRETDLQAEAEEAVNQVESALGIRITPKEVVVLGLLAILSNVLPIVTAGLVFLLYRRIARIERVLKSKG